MVFLLKICLMFVLHVSLKVLQFWKKKIYTFLQIRIRFSNILEQDPDLIYFNSDPQHDYTYSACLVHRKKKQLTGLDLYPSCHLTCTFLFYIIKINFYMWPLFLDETWKVHVPVINKTDYNQALQISAGKLYVPVKFFFI